MIFRILVQHTAQIVSKKAKFCINLLSLRILDETIVIILVQFDVITIVSKYSNMTELG